MKFIRIADYPLKLPDSFFQIKPTSNYWVVGETYRVLESGTENYIRNAMLVHLEHCRFEDFTSFHSYIMKGVDLNTFREMLLLNNNRETIFDIIVFSSYAVAKSYYNDQPELFKEMARMENNKINIE